MGGGLLDVFFDTSPNVLRLLLAHVADVLGRHADDEAEDQELTALGDNDIDRHLLSRGL